MEIKVRVKEYEVKSGENAGNKFFGYKAVMKNGKLMDLRFTTAVEDDAKPTKNCVLVADEDALSVDKSRLYPVLWCSKITEIKAETYSSTALTDYFE